jgi:hypothetical protein
VIVGEKISEDHMAVLAYMRDDCTKAQEKAVQAEEALMAFSRFLVEHYGIRPGDAMTAEGDILRGAAQGAQTVDDPATREV